MSIRATVFLALSLLVFGRLTSALPLEGILGRASVSCGGDPSLSQCGSSFPYNFCCPTSSQCISINSTLATSAVCCPAGRDCSRVATITCNTTLQDPALFPSSPVHSLNLTSQLPTCGHQCCPLGYSCQDSACVLIGQPLASQTAGASDAASSASSTTSSTQSETISPTAPAVVLPSATATTVPTSSANVTQSDAFSGHSFVAGFLPGFLVGALLLALLLWLWHRRSRAHVDRPDRDSRRIRSSHRQISDPIAHPEWGNRTGFFRSPQAVVPEDAGAYECAAHECLTPGSMRKLRIPSLFHRSPTLAEQTFDATPSPKLTQLPVSLRRGSITPPRALRTKASNHSLRRQMSKYESRPAGQKSNESAGSGNPSELIRQDSRETIKITMSSPVSTYTPQRAPPRAVLFPRAASATKGSHQPNTWLQYRIPPAGSPMSSYSRAADGGLGTPYTPSKYGSHGGSDSLQTKGQEANNRMTTFSSLMERAGARQEDLLASRQR